jgi:GDP-L-fucose synthase
MFENIIKCSKDIKMIINFDSAAIYNRNTDIINRTENEIITIPKDYYGLSKNIIAKKVLTSNNFHNLRIFGCFDKNELDSRFIKNCILKSKRNEMITIYEDKIMDFFYIQDLISIVKYFLLVNPVYQDINLIYKNNI